MKLELSKIRLDGGTQPRAALRTDVIEDYAESMKAGVVFPAVTVYFDGTDYWLADGFHRLEAARRASPDQPIEVEVCEGSLSDAQWYSYGANRCHGLRRTNEDKQRVVQNAMQHPKALELSNVQIADHCGVNEITIRRHRKAIDATSTMSKSDTSSVSAPGRKKPRPRTGRDGRTIDTSRIGKHKKNSARNGRKLSPKAAMPVLGHSLPNPMISLSLPPANPVIAAATIFKLFDTSFVRTLVAELTQRLKGQDDE